MTDPTSQDSIWAYYQNQAPHVFGGGHSHPRLEFMVHQASRLAGGTTGALLNIGIGDGHLEKTAQKLGWSVHSLDPSAESVRQLVGVGIDARVGRLEAMPFPDAQFDCVVASEVLEHLGDDQRRQGLSEIHRTLKIGGYLLGSVPYRELLDDNVAMCPQCQHVFHRWGHATTFDLNKLRAELAPHFRDIACRRTAFVPFRGRTLSGKCKSLARLILAKCGASIAVPSIFFVARK